MLCSAWLSGDGNFAVRAGMMASRQYHLGASSRLRPTTSKIRRGDRHRNSRPRRRLFCDFDWDIFVIFDQLQLMRIVESHAEGCTLASMGNATTLLSPVQEGRIWRVRIEWANGAIHHFGKFTSEEEAIRWIGAHPRLTKPVTEDEPSITRKRVRSRKARLRNLFST